MNIEKVTGAVVGLGGTALTVVGIYQLLTSGESVPKKLNAVGLTIAGGALLTTGSVMIGTISGLVPRRKETPAPKPEEKKEEKK